MRIYSLNFKLLFQWKDTENGRQLMKHMKVMEDFNKQSNRLAGGDPMGKYFWLFFFKIWCFFYGFNLFFYNDTGPQYEHARTFLESHPDLRSVGTLTKDEWEAITLYLVFAFKKMKWKKEFNKLMHYVCICKKYPLKSSLNLCES